MPMPHDDDESPTLISQELEDLNTTNTAPQGGYKVINVLLVESVFKRNSTLDFPMGEIANVIHTEPTPHETVDGKFAVTFLLNFQGNQQETNVFEATIKMIGLFEKFGEPPLPDEVFKQINAPAIIYPFIREHLHNVCLKAGILNIFLPTVNFKV